MKRSLLAIVLLLYASLGFAQTMAIEKYEIRFSISEDSVRETIQLTLQNPAESIRFATHGAYDTSARNSQGPIGFSILQENDVSIIDVFPKNDTFVEISFSSREQIMRSGNTFQFFSELSLPTDVKSLHIDFVLPPGFVVEDYYPSEGGMVRSDGRSIIVSWDFANPASAPLFVRYSSTQPSPMLAMATAIAAACMAAAGLFYYRRRASREFLKGLFEDESKVVSYLMQHKTAYQNKIEKEFRFSRPKMTRIVFRLEQRGWVKKERRGRTNRLTWIKGTPEEKKMVKIFEARRKAEEQKKAAGKIMEGKNL
ncbi:MAG: hypothetical protein QXL81_00140 [Candidatus Aenigmatarchaeota archaeon]